MGVAQAGSGGGTLLNEMISPITPDQARHASLNVVEGIEDRDEARTILEMLGLI